MSNIQNNDNDIMYYLLCDKNLNREDCGTLTFSSVVECLDFLRNKYNLDVSNIDIFDKNNNCRFYLKFMTKTEYLEKFNKAMEEIAKINQGMY